MLVRLHLHRQQRPEPPRVLLEVLMQDVGLTSTGSRSGRLSGAVPETRVSVVCRRFAELGRMLVTSSSNLGLNFRTQAGKERHRCSPTLGGRRVARGRQYLSMGQGRHHHRRRRCTRVRTILGASSSQQFWIPVSDHRPNSTSIWLRLSPGPDHHGSGWAGRLSELRGCRDRRKGTLVRPEIQDQLGQTAFLRES